MTAHLLVAEDDGQARYSLVQMLTRAGYRVTEASDGETALVLLQQEYVDLVLADIRMGIVDGLAVVEASQQRDDAPAVIVLTGYGSLDTSITALRLGAADYLLKPVEPEQLLASVATALQRRSEILYNREAARVLAEGFAALQQRFQSQGMRPSVETGAVRPPPIRGPDVISIGGLQVGRHRHAVQYHGQPVSLTPTEFVILRCLAEAEDYLLTYEALAECAYDLAQALNVSRSYIYNIESGRRQVSPDTLVDIATHFHVTASSIVNDTILTPQELPH